MGELLLRLLKESPESFVELAHGKNMEKLSSNFSAKVNAK